MSTKIVTTCDKCGKEINDCESCIKIEVFKPRKGITPNTYDLCSACSRSFVEWITGVNRYDPMFGKTLEEI